MLHNIIEANLQRTKHLLRSYYRYKQQEHANVDAETSRLILAILAESMGDKPVTPPEQYRLMDICGHLLCAGITAALDTLKTYPEESGRLAYVVLMTHYLHPDGPTVSVRQLQERLSQMEIELLEEDIQSYLSTGERMATALMFENKILNASILAQYVAE